MPEINSHVILSHIDAPARILIWPADQVLICCIPFAFGMVAEHVAVGMLGSFLAAFMWKAFHKKFGRGTVRAMLYWHLPTSKRLVAQGMPPSYVRFWIR